MTLLADVDYDHPMESVQWGHAENRMPQCVDRIEIVVNGHARFTVTDNYQALVNVSFGPQGVVARQLEIRLSNTSSNAAVALMGIQFK